MFTGEGFSLISGFRKIWCSQKMDSVLIQVSRKFDVHQFFLYCDFGEWATNLSKDVSSWNYRTTVVVLLWGLVDVLLNENNLSFLLEKLILRNFDTQDKIFNKKKHILNFSGDAVEALVASSPPSVG